MDIGFQGRTVFGGVDSTTATGNKCRGSTVPYSETREIDGFNSGKIKSISAMPIYKDRSHEELRSEDYELLNKGSAFQLSCPQFGRSSFGSFTGLAFDTNKSAPVSSVKPPFGSTGEVFSVSPSSGYGSSTFGRNLDQAPKNTAFSEASSTTGFGPPKISGINFNSPPTVVHSNSANGRTGTVFGVPNVSNVTPFASGSATSCFSSSIFGFESNNPVSEGSSTSAFQVSTTPGFGINSSPFWSTSASANSSLSGPQSTFGIGPPSTSSFCVPTTSGFLFSSTSPSSGSSIFGIQSSSGPKSTFGIDPPSTSSFSVPTTSGFLFSSTSPSSGNSIFGIESSTGFQEAPTFGPTVSNLYQGSGSYSATRVFDESIVKIQSSFKTSDNKGGRSLDSASLKTSDTPANIFPFPTSSSQSCSNSPFNLFSPNPPTHISQDFITSNSTTSTTPPPPSVNPFSLTNLRPSQSEAFIPQPSVLFSVPIPTPNLDMFSAKATEVPNQNNNGQQNVSASTVCVQSPLVANPFAIQFTSDRPSGVIMPIQNGISSLPVSNNLSSNKRTSLVRIRHVSLRHNWLPAQKYSPGSSEPKVPFFSGKEDMPLPSPPFLPREDPRAWVMNSSPLRSYSDGKVCEDMASPPPSFQLNVKPTEPTYYTSIREEKDSSTILNCHQDDDDDAITRSDKADVLALMPKLSSGEYYTEPSLKELAERETAEPGYISHVTEFAVGRRGYGSIKFHGETDIRNLDLGSIVQFKNREAVVYPDDKVKPPVGQSLNKPAEVTLLNVKCMSKMTENKQYIDGVRAQSFKEKLIKKSSEQGAEFVSYDPVQGEWKFRVQHF